jgi:sulfur carrier protein ThiS
MAASEAGEGRIKVSVTLFADLRRFASPGQDGSRSQQLLAGATVADALDAAGIPAGEEVTAGLNGERAQRATVLHDGDDLVLFSQMEGG